MIKAILAMNSNRVIGDNNGLVWTCPEDMKRFKRLTEGHIVMMGRKTWDSLPEKFRPLPKRKNIVVSTQVTPDGYPGAEWVSNPISYLREYYKSDDIRDLYIIGGAQLFSTCLSQIHQVELTILHNDTQDGDCMLPEFESEFVLKSSETLNSDSNVVAYTYIRK